MAKRQLKSSNSTRQKTPVTTDDTSQSESSAQWTVMVFMGAASAGGEPLLDAADEDIGELEHVGSGPVVPDGHRDAVGKLDIFVQEHGRSAIPRRSHVKAPQAEFHDVPAGAVDTNGGHALEEFIRWSFREAGHDPRNRRHYSMLVLWGHSFDFAFGRERTRAGGLDALDFAELADTLSRIRERLGYAEAKLDIIGFDTCDASTVEMACQLEPFAHYLLASEIGIPIPGWPYDRILGRLRRPHGRLMGAPEFGSWAVRRFCEAYPPDDATSLTLLDLQRAPLLHDHVDLLAVTLARFVRNAAGRAQLAEIFARSQTDIGRPFVDVVDLCLSLQRELDDVFVRQAADALGDFLLGPRQPLVGTSELGEGQRFIVEHGRNSSATARLNGISLYAPHLAPGRDFEAARLLYNGFGFARDTSWSEIVHAMARQD